jgi:hypothetical protein
VGRGRSEELPERINPSKTAGDRVEFASLRRRLGDTPSLFVSEHATDARARCSRAAKTTAVGLALWRLPRPLDRHGASCDRVR